MLYLRKLVEKMQNRIILHFPYSQLIIAKIAIMGITFNKLMRMIAAVFFMFMFPVAIFDNIYNKLTRKFVIGRVQLTITTICTLRCKECSSMVPFFKSPKNMDYKDIVNDIDKLLEAVDYIYALYVYGGEPFVHVDIAKILDYLLSLKKVKKLIVITNGTIIPDKETTNIMKNRRLRVQVSGYPLNVVPNINKLLKHFKENDIHFTYSKSQKWISHGEKKFIERDLYMKRELFDLCTSKSCNTMINGKFYICPISANGMELGIFPEKENDFVDIRKLSKGETIKSLKQLFAQKYISACDFCEGNTFLAKTIEPAEQIGSI